MANEKILVVDDDTNICELLRLYLTKEGYHHRQRWGRGPGKIQPGQAGHGAAGRDDAPAGRPGGLPPHPQDGQHPGDDADGQGRDL